MTTAVEGAALYDAVARVYELNRGKNSISPAWLATHAMVLIRFPRRLHETGYIGCHLQMRQIARSYCRQKFDPTDTDATLDDLFPETLQERYPVRSRAGEEREYVLLDALTSDDAYYNVARMRRASLALQKHADALEAHIRAKPDRAA